MQDRFSPIRSNPMVSIAAGAVVIASITAAGFFSGVLPVARGEAGMSQAVAAPPAATTPAPTATPGSVAARGARHRQVIGNAAAGTPAVTARTVADPSLGRIESIVPVEVKGQASGVGAVAGGVGGALLGSTIGQGNGRTAMAVLGAAGGALAGNAVEKNMKKEVRYDVDVRMDDGSHRNVRLTSMPEWRAGDRVRVDNGRIEPAA